MKTTPWAVLLCALIAACALNAQPASGSASAPVYDTLGPVNPQLTQEAIAYYRKLAAPLAGIKQANYTYLQAITKLRRAKTVEKKRQELLKALQSTKEAFKGLSSFNNDSTLKSEFVGYLDLVSIVLKQDFGKILDMEDIAAQTYDQAEAHQLALDLAVNKLNASFDVVKKVENEFFKKYRITAKDEKDELTLKIEKANKALKYYDAIYRIFYKVNKEDNYAREAVSKKDVAALEQHATTLISFSEEGLKQLKEKTAYEGDDELLENAVKLIELYRLEAQVTYPANVEFSIKSDNFQKSIRKINSIKEGERKKEDVDEYNNEVNLFNKAVKEINKINKTSYGLQKYLIKTWNKLAEDFMKKHA